MAMKLVRSSLTRARRSTAALDLRAPIANVDCLGRPAESFTARMLRQDVRAPSVAPDRPVQPLPVVGDETDIEATAQAEMAAGIDPPPARTAMLLVRIKAESVLPAVEPGGGISFSSGAYTASRVGVAGVVQAIVGRVAGIRAGDAVFGVANARVDGGDVQLSIVDAGRMGRMPARLTFAEAASSALIGASAWQMLFKIGRIDTGETVLILGAETPIGVCTVQLAAMHGVRVVGLTASPSSQRQLLGRGAHRVISGDAQFLESQCRLVSLIVDTVGGALHQRAAAAVQSGCTLVSCVAQPDVFTAARRGSRSVSYVVDATTHCLSRIATLIDDGLLLTTPIHREFGRA